jgi:hypothetical protein
LGKGLDKGMQAFYNSLACLFGEQNQEVHV